MDINWQALITGAVTVFVIVYFSKRAAFSVKEGDLKYGLFIKGLGVVCLFFSLGSLALYLTENYQVDKAGETTALIGLFVGFGIAAIYTIGEGFFVKGSFDKQSISFFTPWTGRKVQSWENLFSVKFNPICYWYVLKFNTGNVIRLSSYLGGHGHLLAQLQEYGHDF